MQQLSCAMRLTVPILGDQNSWHSMQSSRILNCVLPNKWLANRPGYSRSGFFRRFWNYFSSFVNQWNLQCHLKALIQRTFFPETVNLPNYVALFLGNVNIVPLPYHLLPNYLIT
jgi:hypothetical protein